MIKNKSPIYVNIIGCGNVGQLLGCLLHDSKDYVVQQFYSRDAAHSEHAAKAIGASSEHIAYSLDALKPADMYCLSVSDDAIHIVCEQLLSQHLNALPQASQACIFHCSGALTADEALHAAAEKGWGIGSMHPALSVWDASKNATLFAGTACGIESMDATVEEKLTAMVKALGGKPFGIPSHKKLLYHAALVIACNYMSVLVESSLTLFKQLSIDNEQALSILTPLLKPMLEGLLTTRHSEVMSGPAVRGDATLLKKQAVALSECDQSLHDIYCHLGHCLVALAQKAGKLSSQQSDACHTALESKK